MSGLTSIHQTCANLRSTRADIGRLQHIPLLSPGERDLDSTTAVRMNEQAKYLKRFRVAYGNHRSRAAPLPRFSSGKSRTLLPDRSRNPGSPLTMGSLTDGIGVRASPPERSPSNKATTLRHNRETHQAKDLT